MLLNLWATLLLVITVTYLFVCVDGSKGGILAQIKLFLFNILPELIRQGLRRIFGEWFVLKIDGFSKYLCYSQNPLVQIIYVLAAGGGFSIYVLFGFPHIPGPYLGVYHKYAGSLLMLCCYYSYYQACRVDPGYIT